MKTIQNNRTGFGEYLLNNGLISDEQLELVLKLQNKHRLLEELALEFNIIRSEDLPTIHDFMKQQPSLLFGEAAISLGLMNFNQLRYLLDVRTRRKMRIGDILLQEKLVTEEALRNALMAYHDKQKKFKNILIVEPSSTIITILKRTLNKYGYTTRSCRSGSEGAELVKSFQPEIVIVSGELADIDGFAFCQQMLSESMVVTSNYVLLSSNLREDNIDRAFAAGVNHFLSKPVNENELINLIFQIEKEVLKKRQEKVLVVDDSIGPRMVISKELSSEGFQVFQAVNGEEAVRLAREIKPDLITMDLEMPVMDGFTACNQLRQQKETADVPVIIISSLSSPDVVARGFDVGAVEFFGKPFRRGELVNFVKALFETSKISKQEKVLVVEDSKTVLHILKYLFRKNGYEVLTAQDGLEGLQLAKTFRPDLIVTDGWMPKKTGWQLAAALKKNSELRHTPVIMLTAANQKKDVLRGLSLGVDDYMTKPFDEPELLARVIVHLDKKRLFDQMRQEQAKLASINHRQSLLLKEISILNRMVEGFQRCRSEEDVYGQVPCFFEQFYPTEGGRLLVKREENDSFDAVISWGEVEPLALPDNKTCPALKQQSPFYLAEEAENGLCAHCSKQGIFVCAPLIVQGIMVGMIQRFAMGEQASGGAPEEVAYGGDKWHLENTIYEHVALAISNTRLRESLLQQSIRDPLTGLFNRRYMVESFDRELSRVERKKASLGVILFDVDCFKRFNDTYGHMAGDVALKRIADITLLKTRKADIACRFGGEEFTIIMPGANLGDVAVRAEQLRSAIAQADKLVFEGQELPLPTISLGVSVYPAHGAELKQLLSKADEALYFAKEAGRNQVKIAE